MDFYLQNITKYEVHCIKFKVLNWAMEVGKAIWQIDWYPQFLQAHNTISYKPYIHVRIFLNHILDKENGTLHNLSLNSHINPGYYPIVLLSHQTVGSSLCWNKNQHTSVNLQGKYFALNKTI